MRTHAFSLILASASVVSAANPFQPTINPNGVVNAASYLSPAFANYGIARGSIFLVFGSALGPVSLVPATSYPLPTSDGLAGTRVLISIGAFNAACPMVYTSINQVAAIMPSNAPEGDGSLVISYQNLASTSVPIHVVRSAFGIFTHSQSAWGPAVAQNFANQNYTPLNTLTASAQPGQTVILWGTGLGPVTGDETSGPLPGALPYLDSLYVGGVQANVRYAGRAGCCAAVDQIVFDVPQGISGCYVPVAAVTGGVVSNFGTISVAASGAECDDPLSYRASELIAAERSGVLRSGQVSLTSLASGEIDFSAAFFSMDLGTVVNSTTRLNPSIGSCSISVSPVTATPTHPGTGLNAGDAIMVTGPPGQMSAANTSSGGYFIAKSPARLSQGSYSFASTGGSDVGPFTATLNMPAPAVWTNPLAYMGGTISGSSPLVFTWNGGDPAGYVTVSIASANSIYNSVLQCNVAPSAGTFTIPAAFLRALYAGPITVSLSSTAATVPFTASGLDSGSVTATVVSSTQTTYSPVVQ
ncbi:MAG TPA: hypothetical protein VMJ75_25115 [Candidatus Acidoferrales bacterium]|nr:hypothetical protein [Candidatus Acidoferrales bacterium]